MTFMHRANLEQALRAAPLIGQESDTDAVLTADDAVDPKGFRRFVSPLGVEVWGNRIYFRDSSAFAFMLGQVGLGDLAPSVVQHHMDMVDAHKQLGAVARSLAFVMAFFREGNGHNPNYLTQHFVHAEYSEERPLSRLGFLAVLAHPRELTPEDIDNIADVDHPEWPLTVARVAELIGEHNDANPDDQLPMPLSLARG